MVNLRIDLPEGFLDEEVRNGYTVTSKAKRAWAVQIDLLIKLDEVCKKYGLRYFADSGTLLGAARDHGFIPWDDDIDVTMLRADYEKLKEVADKEFEYPYFYQDMYRDEGLIRPHAQLRNCETTGYLPQEEDRPYNKGIFLDIFVLDDLFPEKLERQYRRAERLRRQRQKWNHHDFHPNPVRWAVRWSRYLLYKTRYRDSASFYTELEAIFRSPEKSEYLDYLMLNNGPEEVHMLKRTWYEETVQLPFEGRTFPAPKGYRQYLACYYGDDWRIPQNTASMHNLKGQVIFDTGRSYTEVLKDLLGQ